MNRTSNTAGFTLVELIVVIAILAILAGVAVPAYSGYIGRAKDAAAEAELAELVTAVRAAEILCHTEVQIITVDDTGAVRCYIAAERGADGSILTFHEFDISDIHGGSIGKVKTHSTFFGGCTWLRSEQKWQAGMAEIKLFGANPKNSSN